MARSLIAALVAAACLWTTIAYAQPPELTQPVNDFAGVISPADEATLDDLIRRLQAASGDVLIVATVKTFQPEADLQTYANRMFENHGRGIGAKGKDNGVLLVLAVDDREVWTEVGYDLEGIITDGFAGETSRQAMVPFFRDGDYGSGLIAGATRFAQRIAEVRQVSLEGLPVRQPREQRETPHIPFIVWIFIAMVMINVARGVMSGFAGGRRYRRRGRWGGYVGPFGGGYSGRSSGSSWGGGGSFGGGFGGFGGGRSGGGGGGASW